MYQNQSRQLNFYIKFCCNYLLVDISPHRDYWIICEELLLSHLSEIILTQNESLY